jgi:hypothetical protein
MKRSDPDPSPSLNSISKEELGGRDWDVHDPHETKLAKKRPADQKGSKGEAAESNEDEDRQVAPEASPLGRCHAVAAFSALFIP